MKSLKLLILLATLPVLTACFGDDDQDLRDWVAEVKARPSTPIAALPEIRPYEAFIYSAGHLRSPFQTARPEAIGELASVEDCPTQLRPDSNRVREELEDYSLQSLAFVGSMSQQGEDWALIRQNSGSIVRVQKGNYIGLNHGQITSITEQNLQLMEIVSNGQGCWEARPMQLEMDQ